MVTFFRKHDIIYTSEYVLKGGIFLEIKNNNISENTFCVPCVVADNLLKIANGEYIKILLYILRNSDRECSENEISSNTGAGLDVVRNAIDFWRQANILNNTSQTVTIEEKIKVVQNESPENNNTLVRKHWTGKEIRDLRMSSPDISELLTAVESVLGSINQAKAEVIINLHESLGMKKEVIMLLISHCKEMNKTTPDGIYNMACKWISNNINTIQLAENEVQYMKASHNYVCQIMNLLNINRITQAQEKMISEWNSWNISIDMVEFAYETALVKCENKLNISYMNGIITKWHENNISSLNDVIKFNEIRKCENIKKYGKKDDYLHSVMKVFNINQVTNSQESMINNWEIWNISIDMVEFAYEISLPRCQNTFSINYINGIIKDWHEKNIKTLQDAIELSESNKIKNKKKYDDDDFDVDMYKIFINRCITDNFDDIEVVK